MATVVVPRASVAVVPQASVVVAVLQPSNF
jgi:hypothetical protein